MGNGAGSLTSSSNGTAGRLDIDQALTGGGGRLVGTMLLTLE